MEGCKKHSPHKHRHGPGCGHSSLVHNGRTYYVHGGHLHAEHDGHYDEFEIPVDDNNPVHCTDQHGCGNHPVGHTHGPGCGHPMVPHGDHYDYLVEDHLHHPHAGHCDDHGPLELE